MAVALFLLAAVTQASDLSVDRRTLQPGETLRITVRLTGPFASADSVDLPLQNLELDGQPSTSSLFSFFNGTASRSKTFTYSAHARGPGPALVGPLVLQDDAGNRETLPPVAVQVLPDAFSATDDPEQVVRELKASGRDLVFLLTEVDHKSASVGEEVLVTWWLYTAVAVQDFAIDSMPKLPDFWSETLTAQETAQPVVLDGTFLHKVAIRRLALFPLHGGSLPIGSMNSRIATMRANPRPNPFEPFEGSVVELRQHSQPVTLEARPLPAGVAADAIAVGAALRCGAPVQKGNGPVTIDVRLSGRGNLRAAKPPHFATPPAGEWELNEGGVTVSRDATELTMGRSWRFVVFPAHDGPLTVPPLVAGAFDPESGTLRALRCEAQTLEAKSVDRPAPPETPAAAEERQRAARAALVPRLAIGAAALLLLAAALWPLRRWQRMSRAAEELVGDSEPTGVRTRVDARAGDAVALLEERSERGDAYRAVRSLLDDLAYDRYVEGDADRELRRRVAAWLATMRESGAGVKKG